jgi:hypothetical protein
MIPVGYQKIDCHMIFDVKITLDHKAQYVMGGQQTEEPTDQRYHVCERGVERQYQDSIPCC